MSEEKQTIGRTPYLCSLLSGLSERMYAIERKNKDRRCNADAFALLDEDLSRLRKDITKTRARFRKYLKDEGLLDGAE